MNPASLSPLADRWAMASVTSSNRVLAFSYQPSGSQLPGNGAEGIPVLPIRPFVIAQKMPVGNTHLAVSEPLTMAPGHVFRNAPAFFLCQAAHDSDEEFPFTNQSDTK